MNRYVLRDKNPVKMDDLFEWSHEYEKSNRTVAHTVLPGDVVVSTVFLGIDHSWSFNAEHPILFETMIFGGPHDEYQKRYCTWEEAEKGHQEAVKLAKSP